MIIKMLTNLGEWMNTGKCFKSIRENTKKNRNKAEKNTITDINTTLEEINSSSGDREEDQLSKKHGNYWKSLKGEHEKC